MYNWVNRHTGYVLILFIAITFLCANGLQVINYPPKSIHQWRQSDCLAYAKNYYQKSSGLFTPSTYNLAGRDGRVMSEFPVIYYVAGKLFKVFGLHYFLLRGLTFICFLLGLYYLYKCILLWMKPSFIAAFPILILASSPFYYYYALNYLPNVPAISFSFAGLYYLLSYGRTNHRKHLIWGTFFFVLATLLKPTDGGLVWAAYMGVTVIQYLQRKITNQLAIGIAISAAIILATIYGWYKYTEWYNNVNGNHQNLQSIYPIWDMIQKDVTYVWEERIQGFWAASYQQRSVLYFMVVLVVIYIVRLPVLNPFLRLSTFFAFIGTLAYDLLWYKAFSDHDYYQLVNVIPCIFLFITVLEWYANRILTKLPAVANYGIELLLFGMVAVSIYHCRNIQHERYSFAEFRYFNPDIYEVEPYLRQLGIKPTDAIVSVPDPSPNITLAAYGTQGYTESFNDDHFNINYFQSIGAQYLIICDTSYLSKPLYLPYLTKQIGKFRDNIYVFDIRQH